MHKHEHKSVSKTDSSLAVSQQLIVLCCLYIAVMSIKGCTADVLLPNAPGHQSEHRFPVLMGQNGLVVLNQCQPEGFHCVPDLCYTST